MQLASLLAVSTPTHFINSGSRINCGDIGVPESYEPSGILVGQVGCRFERQSRMEIEHCMISDIQNTLENGYGPPEQAAQSARHDRLQLWSEFYGIDHFPTYEEASREHVDGNPRFISVSSGGFLDRVVYQRRMKICAEMFLAEANERGRARAEGGEMDTEQGIYCYVVGLGLGVWQIAPIQTELYLECYRDALASFEYPFISNICFGWIPERYCTKVFGITNGDSLKSVVNSNIKISFSRNDPAAKLRGENQGKLLVAQYAWDGNSWPGNEYWLGSLSASGDPAAAACSTIPQLQNPDVNSEYVLDQMFML